MMSQIDGTVAVDEATLEQREVIKRLLQLYLHDFSEHARVGSLHGEVDERGRFAYSAYSLIESYWNEPGRVPLLIRAGGHIAGFILLNRWSALDRSLDRAIAEFFVLRKYRRAGVGTRAAHLVFRRYPGRWEVPVADYNPEALLFWRSVVRLGELTSVVEYPGDGQRWSGTVLRFESARGE